MAYRKETLSKDDKGFFRWLGKDGDGKYIRFRLGTDPDQATLANARLKLLWARVEATTGTWEKTTLAIGKAVAKGLPEVVLEYGDDNLDPIPYAGAIAYYARHFGDIIRILPARPQDCEHGKRENEKFAVALRGALDILTPSSPPTAGRLHDALDDYVSYLRHGETTVVGWTRVKVVQAETLKDRHKDIPLAELTLETMEGMVAYWARRPKVKGRDKPISALTARNQIKQLKDFWKWLHRSDRYAWKRPDGHDELRVRISQRPEDQTALMNTVHVPTFTIEELTILYRYASPLVKTFMLLGLNCGFAIAEIASLTLKEIHLSQPHPHASRMKLATLPDDSWIRRVRVKSGVYGEFKLWQPTVQAIRWAMARTTGIAPNAPTLLVTDIGRSFVAPTKTGNKSSRIPNLWNNLYRTVHREHKPAFRYLPIKNIRKTAGDMVRDIAGGEIAGVFLCHGTPVKSDVLSDIYTNRPFGRVFQAIEEMGKLLQPMFAAVQGNPFPL